MLTTSHWGRNHESSLGAFSLLRRANLLDSGEHGLRHHAPQYTARDGALWTQMFCLFHRRDIRRCLGHVLIALDRNAVDDRPQIPQMDADSMFVFCISRALMT